MAKLARIRSFGSQHTELEIELLDTLEGIVEGAAADGLYLPTEKLPAHRVGCECEWCLGLRLVAYAAGGGRCILCGCHDDRACEDGCAWAPGSWRLVCTAHPKKTIAAAIRLVRREARGVRGGCR